MFTCLIDNAQLPTEQALHNYVSRKLKVKIEDYYQKYYPRYDILTGELIEFKNREFYFHSLFNTRENLVKFFKKTPDKAAMIKCLELRKEWKKLTNAPSTVEARTSILPSPIMIQRMGLDYNLICEQAGLKPRYNYEASLTFDDRPLEILVDTREQKPLPIKAGTTVAKLDFGDYTSSSHYKQVFIERKSLIDMCGTLSQGFERFQREVSRAADMDSYLVVVVEENLSQLSLIGKTPTTKSVKASSDFFGVRIRSLYQQFENIQFLFVDGRVKMTEIIEKVLRLENDVKSLDLQFYYDSKLL